MKRSEGETYKTDEISDLEEGISLHDPELEAHKKKEYFMWRQCHGRYIIRDVRRIQNYYRDEEQKCTEAAVLVYES